MLFMVEADKYDWDQYDSFIVNADNEEQAIQFVYDYIEQGIYSSELDDKQIWTAKLLDIDSLDKGVIHESFNAG